MKFRLIWAGGPHGAGWLAMAEGLAALANAADPMLEVVAVPGGGRENPARANAGEVALGMSVDFLVAAARRGEHPYEGPPMTELCSLGAGWSSLPFHIARAADARAPDLAAALTRSGCRIAVPPPETSDELTFRRVLDHCGSSYEAIRTGGGLVLHDRYDNLVEAFVAGRVDWLFGATTRPAAVIERIAGGGRPAALLPFPEPLLRHLAERYGYGRGVIPAGSYPALHAADLSVTCMETAVAVSAAAPEEAIYRLSRALLADPARLAAVHESLGAFDPRAAASSPPAPLHPGAARAWRELGLIG